MKEPKHDQALPQELLFKIHTGQAGLQLKDHSSKKIKCKRWPKPRKAFLTGSKSFMILLKAC
jgi:hypothetical protein